MAGFDRLAAAAVLATELVSGAATTADGVAQRSTIVLDQAIAPYEYRDRSRSMQRDRKWGRSRDERGEDSQRSSIRSGFETKDDDVESSLNESDDVDREEQVFEEREERL